MFGKFFASTFTGSMMSAGTDVFAVWGYVIAHTVNSRVELNPRLLAAMIGSTPEKMKAAIDYLCLPDSESRSKENDGRRLVKEGEFQYFVTNHIKYRSIRDEEGRREYNREKKREERARKSGSVKPPVNDSQSCQPPSAQAEAEAEAEAEESDTSNPATTVISTAKRVRGADRGTRLPEDWQLSDEDRAFAIDLGLDPDLGLEEFRDYWTSVPGARARKLDWSRTFRNRCRELGRRPKSMRLGKSDEEIEAAIERSRSFGK